MNTDEDGSPVPNGLTGRLTDVTAPTRAPRKRPSHQRRGELLDAAQALFRKQGVAATTIDEITERAGVAKGTFYLYFDSKEHVAAAVHERLVEGMASTLADVLESADLEAVLERGDVDEFLEVGDRIIAAIIDYWMKHRRTYIAVAESGETPQTTAMMAESDRRMIDTLAAGLELASQRGLVDVPDPRRTAQFIYFGCQGGCKTALFAPGRPDRDRLVQTSQAMTRKILRPATVPS